MKTKSKNNNVASSKLTSFVLGTQKKTRFQREKEERELKKKQAEQEAAKIYEDFVASFDGSDNEKEFVREGSSSSRGRGGFDVPPPSSSSRHFSSDKKSGSQKKMSNMELMMLEMKERQEMRTVRRTEKKKGQIDSFMEELKAKQEGNPLPPSALDVVTGVNTPGSIDDGDPETTNLYVGNLAPTITEETLQEIFGQYGEIYSVKIMWPRTEEERARKRNCGFVSYMRRADAEDAKIAMHDQDLEGYRISVGWGKAIKKLSNPGAITPLVPLAPKLATAGKPSPKESSDGKGRVDPSMVASIAVQQLAAKAVGAVVDKPSGGGKSGKWDVAPQEMEQEMTDIDEKIEVIVPDDRKKKYLIDRLARYVAKDGQPFEQKIREKEISNPEYAFLTNHSSAEGLYYRWRVWSLLMGDRERKWREKPFQMAVGGPFWIPPRIDQRSREDEEREERRRKEREEQREKDRERQRIERNERYKYMTGRQLEKARDKERGRATKTQLSDSEYDRISDMLRALTNSRQKIKEAMGFALDNADCSEEIVQLLQESLTLTETPIPVKMARLYLLSDVLHNSSAPVRHASSYRTHFQTCLPSIFESLNEALNNPALGRMSARSFEEKIMKILTIWEGWSLYPPLFINGLEATFQRKEKNMGDIPGVNEADLDREGLEKKAKQAGLAFSEQDSSMTLLKKLTHLNKYIKAKAMGRRGELLEEPTEKPNETPKEEPKQEVPDISQQAQRPTSAQPAVPTPISKPRGTWKVAGDESDDEDVDGVPLGEDVDGVPLEDEEDVDGVPLEKEESASPKVNLLGGAYGSDSDSDVDGVPMEDSKTTQGSVRINSKVNWTSESPPKSKKSSPMKRPKLVAASSDSESDSDSEEERRSRSEERSESSMDMFNDSVASVEKMSSKERRAQIEEEEENRLMLRKIENEVMEYRDNLERQGYNSSEIDARIERKRAELTEDWEEERESRRERAKAKKQKELYKEKESSRKKSKERKSSKKHSNRDRDEKSYKRSKRDRSRSRDRSSSSKDKKKKKSDKRR